MCNEERKHTFTQLMGIYIGKTFLENSLAVWIMSPKKCSCPLSQKFPLPENLDHK